jgi:protein subunit release factor A
LLDRNDLKIDVYESSGAGGNVVSRAVRLTHLPSGRIVALEGNPGESRRQLVARATTELRRQLDDA